MVKMRWLPCQPYEITRFVRSGGQCGGGGGSCGARNFSWGCFSSVFNSSRDFQDITS